MGKYRVEESTAVPRSEHPDYRQNLLTAENFIKKTQKSLLRGMSVNVCDTHNLKKSVMTVAWTPPVESNRGRCATPISLHQKSSEVNAQIENIFSCYLKCVGKFEKDHPMQKGFL